MFINPPDFMTERFGRMGLVPLGVTMILETYKGIERQDPFFETEEVDMTSYMTDYPYIEDWSWNCEEAGDPDDEACFQIFFVFGQE